MTRPHYQEQHLQTEIDSLEMLIVQKESNILSVSGTVRVLTDESWMAGGWGMFACVTVYV